MTLGILPDFRDAFMIKIWLAENRLCVLCVFFFFVHIISSSFIWLIGLKFLFLYKGYEINSTIFILLILWIHKWEISTLAWFYINLEVISTKKLHLLKSQLTWLWQLSWQRSHCLYIHIHHIAEIEYSANGSNVSCQYHIHYLFFTLFSFLSTLNVLSYVFPIFLSR